MSEKKTLFITIGKPRSQFNRMVTQFTFLLQWVGMFWVNQTYLDSAIPNWALVAIFVVFLVAVATLAVETTRFDNAADAKNRVEEFYGDA